MRNRLQRHVDSQREDGFTLIELLIVIVILGILAAIVVFAVGSARDDAKSNSCKADQKTVNTAAEAYKAKNGNYPADMSAMTPSFLKSVPNGGTNYTITYSSTSGSATNTCP